MNLIIQSAFCACNQKCEIQPTLINFYPNEYSQNFHYYPFTIKLDRCAGRCNTINDLSNKLCIPNKTRDLNLSVFNMTSGINQSEKLRNHRSWGCKCKFNGTKCKSNQWWNNDNYQCDRKKIHVSEKEYVWNPHICNCENEKYLAGIMDDSAIICGEVKSNDEKIKTIPTNFNEKNITCKTQNFCVLLAFLLITITLFIAVSIYCHLIKYLAKQKRKIKTNLYW